MGNIQKTLPIPSAVVGGLDASHLGFTTGLLGMCYYQSHFTVRKLRHRQSNLSKVQGSNRWSGGSELKQGNSRAGALNAYLTSKGDQKGRPGSVQGVSREQ